MTTIDEQSPKTVRNSKFTPPPPTPFSSPVGSIVDDDSMNIDPEKAMTTVSGQARRNKRSTVSFSNVEIIELPYTLGDNPSVSSGAPISASWIAQKRTILDLDFFERFRPERRNKRALQLSKDARKSMYVPNCYEIRSFIKPCFCLQRFEYRENLLPTFTFQKLNLSLISFAVTALILFSD